MLAVLRRPLIVLNTMSSPSGSTKTTEAWGEPSALAVVRTDRWGPARIPEAVCRAALAGRPVTKGSLNC